MSHLLPRRTDESWQLELHRLHQDGEPLSTLLPATPYILHVRPDALERVEVQDAGRQLDDGQPVWVRIGEHADYAVTTLTCAAATAAGSARTRTKFKRTFRIACRAVGPAFLSTHSTSWPGQDRHHQEQTPHSMSVPPHLPRVIRRGRHNAYRVKKPRDKAIRHTAPPPSASPTSFWPAPQHDPINKTTLVYKPRRWQPPKHHDD